MRIWSLHPSQLDRTGLVACWREALLAQAVLAERTKGYRNHPQLTRFRDDPRPVEAIGAYLAALADEADARGYRFDRTRVIHPDPQIGRILVADGQLAYEWEHLGAKLRLRSPDLVGAWEGAKPRPHPLFHVIPGGIELWEVSRGRHADV